MTAPSLELINVRAGYGRIDVLHDLSLSIPAGKAMALLGANGAGKSTTVQVVSGRLTPKSGCLHVGGNHVNGASAGDLAKAGVCTVPEGRGIFPNLTVDENLWVTTYTAPGSRAEVRERAFTHFPPLGARRDQLAGTLSGGEQQMLAMSRALVSDPSLLVLDEVSMGLAPMIVQELFENVARLKEMGIAMLIVEQFAETALGIADYAAIMTHGRIQAVGLPEEISAALAGAYLGGAA